VQLGALDFLEQHRGDHRLAVLGLEREARNHVGFGCKQVKRRAHTARADSGHCVKSLFLKASLKGD
jgi:hypothetical protein